MRQGVIMVKCGKFVKIVGMKFDVLKGVEIILEKNARNFQEVSCYADNCKDDNVIFIGIPCNYTYKR